MIRRATALVILGLLAGCALTGTPDRLDLGGLVFHRISPAAYGLHGTDFYLMET